MLTIKCTSPNWWEWCQKCHVLQIADQQVWSSTWSATEQVKQTLWSWWLMWGLLLTVIKRMEEVGHGVCAVVVYKRNSWTWLCNRRQMKHRNGDLWTVLAQIFITIHVICLAQHAKVLLPKSRHGWCLPISKLEKWCGLHIEKALCEHVVAHECKFYAL